MRVRAREALAHLSADLEADALDFTKKNLPSNIRVLQESIDGDQATVFWIGERAGTIVRGAAIFTNERAKWLLVTDLLGTPKAPPAPKPGMPTTTTPESPE